MFVTIGGLRGALCLIMVQTVTLDMGSDPDSKHVSEKLSAVKAALALWTAGIVLCTLVINAPALTFVLRLTGLTKVSILTLQARDKARRSLMQFTAAAIEELQEAEDDLFKARPLSHAVLPCSLSPKASVPVKRARCRPGFENGRPCRTSDDILFY